MKKNIMILVCTILGLAQNSSAQMVAPATSDKFWGNAAWLPNNVINGVNTAMIDYPITPNIRGQLAVCAYGATPGTTGSCKGGFVIKDLTRNLGWQIPISIFGLPGGPVNAESVPDVIIGNSALYDTTFVMALAYVDNYNQVRVDFFDLVFWGSPIALSVGYNSSVIMPTLGCEVPMGTVHIDIVAEYGNTNYGRPICQKLFVTYDASSGCPPGGPNIYAAYGDLSTYSLIAGPVFIPGFTGGDNQCPDVAGVQVPSGGGTKDIGRIAYKSSSSTTIYEYDWDPSVAASTGGTTLATGLSYIYEEPRIDAIDDYNNSTSGSHSNYKVVCGVYDAGTGAYESISSDAVMDLAGTVVSNWVSFGSCPTSPYSSFPASGYNHYLPAVAYGSAGANHYMITEGFSEGGTNGDFYVMCPVDITAPTSVAPDLALGNSYFLLNTNYPLTSTATRYTNSVSTPCNAVDDSSLVVWTEYSGSNYNIWGKRGGYDYSSSAGYYYKPGSNDNNVIMASPIQAQRNDLTLFPNPAQDVIYIGNVEGQYSIMNMLGQEVMKGDARSKKLRIDIHDLSPGTYIFNCISQGMPPLNKVFIKN